MSKPIEVFIVTPEISQSDNQPATMTRLADLASAIYANNGHILNPAFLNQRRFERALMLSPRYGQEFLEANLPQADIAMGILSSGNPRSALFIENALKHNTPVTLFQSDQTPFPVELSRVRTLSYQDRADLFMQVQFEFARERLLHGK